MTSRIFDPSLTLSRRKIISGTFLAERFQDITVTECVAIICAARVKNIHHNYRWLRW